MARQKTNRTEGIFLKVSKDVKADIQRRIRIGLNLSEEFETWFRMNFMVKQVLEQDKFKLEERLLVVNAGLENIRKQELAEQKLTLTAIELSKLRDMAMRFNSLDSQHKAFIAICETQKDLSKKEFGLIRKKYIN